MREETNGTEYIMMRINSRRKELGIKQRQLVYGICETGIINKVIKGSGRKMDKTAIDVFIQRLGMKSKSFEAFLDADEYELLLKREYIRKLIDEKQIEKAETEIKDYECLNLSNIDRQFAGFFMTHVMAIRNAPIEEQIQTAMDAIRLTIPEYEPVKSDKYLYSDVEIQLAVRIALLIMKLGKEKESVEILEKLYSLADTKVYSEDSMGKFAQITYELAKYKNKTGDYQKAIEICTKAIAKMPKENRFRFLPQIFNEKAKAEVKLLYTSNSEDDEKYRDMFENSIEHRYYNMLNSIYVLFEYEFEPDEHYVMVMEYNGVPLGKIIRQRRLLMNMKQAEIIIGDGEAGNEENMICSEDTVSKLENGKASTSWKVVRQLLKKVNLPPARYFDSYISSDVNASSDLSKIAEKLGLEEYKDAMVLLKQLEEKNEYRDYPYNKMHIARNLSIISTNLKAASEEKITELLTNAFECCIPGYLKKHESIFLLLEEVGTLTLVLGKRMKIGKLNLHEKIQEYERIIKGYADTGCNNDICIRHLLSIRRIYESSIANAGELEKANAEAIESIRLSIKHDMLGNIGLNMYDYAWNHVKLGEKSDKYGYMINCAYATEKLMHSLPTCRIFKNFYFKEFDEQKWDEF